MATVAVAAARTLAMDDGSPPDGRPEAAEAEAVSGAAADVGDTAMDDMDAGGGPLGKAAAPVSVAASPAVDSSAAVASGAPMAVDPSGVGAGGDGSGGASAATAAAAEPGASPRATPPNDDSGSSEAGDGTPVTVVDMSHEPTGGLGVGYTLPATVEVSMATAGSPCVRLLIAGRSSFCLLPCLWCLVAIVLWHALSLYGVQQRVLAEAAC